MPTLAESGIAARNDFESTLTYGLLAMRATPAAQVEALGRQILQAAGTPACQPKLGMEGAEPMPGGTAQHAARIQQESAKWAGVIEASGTSI